MDRVTERLIKSGVKPETARETARDSMRRTDRAQRDKGQR
jgi:hypothetical protein